MYQICPGEEIMTTTAYNPQIMGAASVDDIFDSLRKDKRSQTAQVVPTETIDNMLVILHQNLKHPASGELLARGFQLRNDLAAAIAELRQSKAADLDVRHTQAVLAARKAGKALEQAKIIELNAMSEWRALAEQAKQVGDVAAGLKERLGDTERIRLLTSGEKAELKAKVAAANKRYENGILKASEQFSAYRSTVTAREEAQLTANEATANATSLGSQLEKLQK
jgi:hypothetical protein